MNPISCEDVCKKLRCYLRNDDIVLYRGGNFEKHLCSQMIIPSINIEMFDVPKIEKIHDSPHFKQCAGHMDRRGVVHCPVVEIKTFGRFLIPYRRT